jgi:hypothetical protein
MPFGLCNAPSSFQRYINKALGPHLDDYCSAYADDVIIFSNGSKKDHAEKTNSVISTLHAAGLLLEIKKSEFRVQEIKYLGFIVAQN